MNKVMFGKYSQTITDFEPSFYKELFQEMCGHSETTEHMMDIVCCDCGERWDANQLESDAIDLAIDEAKLK